MARAALIGAVVLLVASVPAAAHTRSQSFSSWRADGAMLTGLFQVDAQRVTQLGEEAAPDNLERVLAAHLARTVTASQAGTPCTARAPRPLAAPRGDFRVELAFDCARPLAVAPATVLLGAFFDVSPSHIHYARVEGSDGLGREVLATVRSHLFEVGAHAASGPATFGAFVRLGMEHVLSGIDHLAFLAALALLAGGLVRAAWTATGFTLGHSLTLGLVAAGWLHPDSRSVEALIGFTVAFAAGEAFVSGARVPVRIGWLTLVPVATLPLAAKLVGVASLPWAVVAGIAGFAACSAGVGGTAARRLAPALATAFGLAHGAGFAGALLALEIPRGRLLAALVGFNVGVEAAQIVALAVLAAIALLATRLPPALRRNASDYVTTGLFGLGVYWFVGRALL
jgi:hypothetical protein